VERNGGGVAVRSDPGNGTEVRMEVPRTDPG
jgi:signal transduction histidine kinase